MMCIASLVLFLGYIGWYLIKHGVPDCLSSTYYKTGNLFTGILALCSFLLLPEMGTLGIPLVFCILLVACAPRFGEFERKVHMTGAIIAMILSQVMIGVEGSWWIMGMIALPWWLSRKNWLFWLEIIFFLEIYVNEILKQI